jgi:hypothetical protein
MCGEQKKKIREIKFGNYGRCKFGPHYLLSKGAGMPILNSSADFFNSLWRQQFAAFCLFVRTLPIDFVLLGRKRKYIKSKTTAKLREIKEHRSPWSETYCERLAPFRLSFFLVTDYLKRLSVTKKLLLVLSFYLFIFDLITCDS